MCSSLLHVLCNVHCVLHVNMSCASPSYKSKCFQKLDAILPLDILMSHHVARCLHLFPYFLVVCDVMGVSHFLV